MRWPYVFLLLGGLAASGPAFPSDPLSDKGMEWKKCSASEGLDLYWAKVDGSQVIAFRGEGIVDAPLEKVASIIIDTTRATEWIDSLISSKVVRSLSPSQFVEYDLVGIPFPFDTLMANRDFVSQVTVEGDAARRRMTVTYRPAEDDQAPVLKKFVRGTMVCRFQLVPMSIPEETYVEAEIHCDPKGGVPKWLVNFFQQGWPQTTFQRLRKQAGKADVKVLPVVEKLMEKRRAGSAGTKK